MVFRVDVREEAQLKMRKHTKFLAKVSLPASERLSNEYIKALSALQENPQMHPVYYPNKPTVKTFRSKLFYKSRFRIVYEIVGENVYVYDIQDCRQDKTQNII